MLRGSLFQKLHWRTTSFRRFAALMRSASTSAPAWRLLTSYVDARIRAFRKWRHRLRRYRRPTDHVTGDDARAACRVSTATALRCSVKPISTSTSCHAELNGLARSAVRRDDDDDGARSLIESSDVINWLKLINGIPLVVVVVEASRRPSSGDGAAGAGRGRARRLSPPGRVSLNRARYRRRPRTRAARPDLMRRWAVR